MNEPKRIQRKRTKGWRMPDGAIYVGRPTRWGNPFAVGGTAVFSPTEEWWTTDSETDSRALAVRMFADALKFDPKRGFAYLEVAGCEAKYLPVTELCGHDLACWCPLDQPCHADVLLDLANGGAA